MTYAQTLRAYGFSEDVIARDSWANEMQRFNNFERYTSPQPSAAVSPGLAASLTAQPQPFADEQRVGPEAGRMRTEAGPVAAPGTAYDNRRPPSSPTACASPPPAAVVPFDPDALDVTSDDEPDLPWEPLPGDYDMTEF